MLGIASRPGFTTRPGEYFPSAEAGGGVSQNLGEARHVACVRGHIMQERREGLTALVANQTEVLG